MKLEIVRQYGILSADQWKYTQGALVALLGLAVVIFGAISGLSINLPMGAILIGIGSVIALWGISMGLKFENLYIVPDKKRIYRKYAYLKPIEEWDTDFLLTVEARIIQTPNNKSWVAVFIKFKIGSEQQVLTEPGESIPQNCINYINMLLAGEEVPDGTFKD